MVSVLGSLLEGVGRLAPSADGLLPGQDEARNARADKVPEAHSKILPTASLRVCHYRHSRIELANGHWLIAMFLPPEGE
jgi:hypothetical protein